MIEIELLRLIGNKPSLRYLIPDSAVSETTGCLLEDIPLWCEQSQNEHVVWEEFLSWLLVVQHPTWKTEKQDL